jgi:FkbH-like protein
VLLEGDKCCVAGGPELFDGRKETIVELDHCGILQSVASRSDHSAAAAYLKHLGISEYFIAPQIGWSAKSVGVAEISRRLGISLDTILFIDDQEFELEEVRYCHPAIRTLNAIYAAGLQSDPVLRPSVVTSSSRRRRIMYLEDEARALSEKEFAGAPEEFLRLSNIEMTVARASSLDIERIEELIVRTNQLNSTGLVYSKAELQSLINDPQYLILVAMLRDRFGDYGTIGVILIDVSTVWTLKLILVSCRVLSRGIGTTLLRILAARAQDLGVGLRVEFRDTGRNRPMRIALMTAGFVSGGDRQGDTMFFEPRMMSTPPSHVTVTLCW